MKFPKKISHNFKEYFQGLPRTTQFLELVLAALPEWVAALQPLPAVTWPAFIGNGDNCGGGDNGDGDGESCLLLLTLFGCFLITALIFTFGQKKPTSSDQRLILSSRS